MKELALFYSYSGNTKKTAEKFSMDNKCDICEVVDKKRPGKLAAFTAGIVKSMKGSGRQIKPLTINGKNLRFEEYSTINVFAPIWAGHPAPSMNAALKLIPKGSKIKLFMVSQSGNSVKDKISERVKNLGLEIIGYEDIKI